MKSYSFVTHALFIVISSFILSACSFVEPLPGATNVAFVENTSDCKRLGETKVSVLNKVAFISRTEEAMKDELIILAQNEALEMGGNAIKPAGEIEGGAQRFELYRCP